MYRNRHGRGTRGRILSRTSKQAKANIFNSLSAKAFTLLDNKCGKLLDKVDLAITDVPNYYTLTDNSETVIDKEIVLSKYAPPHLTSTGQAKKAKIILYRFPLEARARTKQELFELIYEVLTYQVANFLKIDREDLLDS